MADSKGLVLTAQGAGAVSGTAFGMGTWPVNEVYSAEGLPLEPWMCNMHGACVFGGENIV